MIKIENFLANNTSNFLNYKFYNQQIYFLNMREQDINNFWTFLTENRNYVMGDLIIDDTCITRNVSSSNRRTVLSDNTFFVDSGLWYRQRTHAIKMLEQLANFKDAKVKFKQEHIKWLHRFELSENAVDVPYSSLNQYEKIVLDIILMIIVGKPYNFYYLPDWEKFDLSFKKWLIQNLEMVRMETGQTFIFIFNQEKDNLLDINNKNYTTSNEITIFSDDYKKVVDKKINSFRSFINLAKIILSMFRTPYSVSMVVMFFGMFTAMFMVYSSDTILPFANASIIIWISIFGTFLMFVGFNAWAGYYFKKYKNFVKTQPIPTTSKITYFFYINLILSIIVLALSNLFAWLLAKMIFNPVMTNVYVTYAIFINLGFLILNLVLLALWILLYNTNNFKHSLI